MRIKKIYLEKRAELLKCNQYLITRNPNIFNNKNGVDHRINEPLFKGGSFIKILIPEHNNNNNFNKILTNYGVHPVCLFYENKWHFGNHIKQKNLHQQNKTILSLLFKLKNKIV